jgi:hypothetical protein
MKEIMRVTVVILKALIIHDITTVLTFPAIEVDKHSDAYVEYNCCNCY